MSYVADFVRMMNEKVFADDIVLGILANTNKENLMKDPDLIHGAFYLLKQDEKFRELLREFRFDLSGLRPYCELLDEVLFRLEASSILGTLNPKYEFYQISEEKRMRLKDSISWKFSKEQREMFTEMGSRFESLVGC